MKKSYKPTLIFFFILTLTTILFGFLYYGTFNLLVFINTSFFFSGLFLSLSLLILVTKNGFFDGITFGFRKIIASRQMDKDLENDIRNEMRPPSELVDPISLFPMFTGSFLLFLCMIFSLFGYYYS
ncbi:DUF3899 domain-containing protein [Sutcliffiella halmapala]|uniref:DUF3899 domain-containing protein n=1 Tax=Sutcliffiella halmapala TaxID=79882 RepID=UPI00099547FA|nr:DUF3899 domain-containing protein [Sutcliffiella halmapala]